MQGVEAPVLLTTEKAAELLHCSKSYLEQRRGKADALSPFGGAPPSQKLRTGRVVYPLGPLLAWAIENPDLYAETLVREALVTLKLQGKEGSLIDLARKVAGDETHKKLNPNRRPAGARRRVHTG